MATVYPHSCCPDSSQGSRKNPYPYTYHQPPYHPEGGRGGEGGRGYEGKDCVRPPGPSPPPHAYGVMLLSCAAWGILSLACSVTHVLASFFSDSPFAAQRCHPSLWQSPSEVNVPIL